ncbi:L-tyrosine/L-tryptophan isonitrile synthase family protein [Kitasatospora sp. GAS1066B]|uniref:L-tyrosine/L-tryptophan isonitrile synthase family protein n=1 Tax=Kitasatospora sp. GAS1066B TaxID=3156271 RepID=UPI00351710C4
MPPVATITPHAPSIARTCAAILELLLPHRRATDPDTPTPVEAFPEQLCQLADFVTAGHPIVFTLPGFPCKSPSPAKVLGHLPDEGERLCLTFLNSLCSAVQRVYPPGASMVICSDGHIFGDLIHVPDQHIDAYCDELAALIRREHLHHLSVFDLRDILGHLPYDQKRTWVHTRYAPTIEELRAEVKSDDATLALYRGITRFLTEDSIGFEGTRSALQRDCRQRAYGVIQRSRAWGDLIAEHHTRSVRLSIHPQPRGGAKFGIQLLDAKDTWTTPWHSTAVHRADGRWELMHRSDAERLGRLVLRAGRPSHFEAAQRSCPGIEGPRRVPP